MNFKTDIIMVSGFFFKLYVLLFEAEVYQGFSVIIRSKSEMPLTKFELIAAAKDS